MDANPIQELCQAKNYINFGASVDLLFYFANILFNEINVLLVFCQATLSFGSRPAK